MANPNEEQELKLLLDEVRQLRLEIDIGEHRESRGIQPAALLKNLQSLPFSPVVP